MENFFSAWSICLSRWVLVSLLLGLGGGLIIFPLLIQRTGHQYSTEKTDGIVIFTGEIQREKTAWYIYRQGLAKKLHISGRYPGFPKNRYSDDISIDIAQNTIQNIQLTEEWIRRNQLKSIRLVTSDYHMPRCLLLAQHVWPNISIIPHPVYISRVNDRQRLLILLAEYIRYLRATAWCFSITLKDFFGYFK